MDDANVSNMPKKDLLNKVSFWVLLLTTALLPVFFLPINFISIQFGTTLLFSFGVIISSILYVVSGLSSGSLDLPNSRKVMLGFPALVPLVYFLSGINNGFSRMSFFGYTFDINTVVFIVLAFVYLFLVSVLFKDKEKVLYSYMAFAASSILFAFFVLIRVLFGASHLSFGVFTNTTSTMLGTWNSAGIFFGLCTIVLLMTVQMFTETKLWKSVFTLGLVVSVFLLALVNFIAIWWVVGLSAFLFMLYSVFNFENPYGEVLSWKKRLTAVPLYPLAVFIVSLVFVVWGQTLGGYLVNKFNVANLEVRPSLGTTMEIAKNTIKTNAVFGSGPNTFITQWLTYKPNDIITTVFWNTDFTNGIGLMPTFVVTTGLAGILSWLVFLGFYVYLGIKSIFVRTGDSLSKYLVTTSFFASLYLWMMTFVYVPSTAVFVLTFFFTGLFFASVYATGIVSTSTKQFNLNPKAGFLYSLTMVAILVGSVSVGYVLYKSSMSLWYYQKSSYALNTNKDSKTSEDYMLKAILAVPNDVYYRALSEIEVFKLNEILAQDAKKVTKEEVQKQFSEVLNNAIKAGVSATEKDPSNYLNWVSLGRIYEAVSVPQLGVQGAYEKAQSVYAEALRRNPKNPGIIMLFARLAVNHGDLKQAEAYTLQAIQAKNNYLDAYFLLTQIEVASNNINAAIQSVTAASIIDPTNPAIFFQLGLLKYNVGDFAGAITALEKATTMTPDYANAKYFLGLSYEVTKQHDKAIKQFEDLKASNPDNKEVDAILTNLKAGKAIFANATNTKPEKANSLPIKENQ